MLVRADRMCGSSERTPAKPRDVTLHHYSHHEAFTASVVSKRGAVRDTHGFAPVYKCGVTGLLRRYGFDPKLPEGAVLR